MNRRQKLLAYVSAMAVAAGAVSPAAASISSEIHKPASNLERTTADAIAFEAAVVSGSKPELEKFLADFPTSEHAPQVVEKLIVLAAAGGEPGWRSLPDGLPPGIQRGQEAGRDLPPGIANQIY
jgi:hypothetical protein